ncbi:MAG: hypothetical protein PUI99_10960 [Clostridiales bacterium]|nr:hypothetical protein [Clostridiales bacterium]
MKKNMIISTFSLPIVFLLCLMMSSVTGLADTTDNWCTHPIPETGLTVKFPNEYYVFYKGMENRNDCENIIGVSYEQILKMMDSQGVVLLAISNDFSSEITINANNESQGLDFNEYSLYELKQPSDQFADYLEASGAEVLDHGSCVVNGKNAMRFYMKMNNNGEIDYKAQYMTTYKSVDTMISTVLTSVDNPVSEDQIDTLESIVGSIK